MDVLGEVIGLSCQYIRTEGQVRFVCNGEFQRI